MNRMARIVHIVVTTYLAGLASVRTATNVVMTSAALRELIQFAVRTITLSAVRLPWNAVAWAAALLVPFAVAVYASSMPFAVTLRPALLVKLAVTVNASSLGVFAAANSAVLLIPDAVTTAAALKALFALTARAFRVHRHALEFPHLPSGFRD